MRAGIGVGRPPSGQRLTDGAFQGPYLAGLRCLLEWRSQVEVTEMLKSSGEKSGLYGKNVGVWGQWIPQNRVP